MRVPSIQVGPTLPLVVRHEARTFRDAAGHGHYQRHGHVGGVVCQHAGCVGHVDATGGSGSDVDVVKAIAEIGDQLELIPGGGDDIGADLIRHGRNQHIGRLHGRDQRFPAHRMVIEIEAGVEQFAHTRLDRFGQLTCHDHQRLFFVRHRVLHR
jgi:hypothetical protein